MMLKQKQKTIDRFLPPEKEAGKVLEGELNQSSKRTSVIIKNRSIKDYY